MAKRHKKTHHPKGQGAHKRRETQRRYAPQSPTVIARLRAFLGHNWVVVRSCLIFGGCLLVFIFLYSKLVGWGALDPFFDFTARATGSLVNLFGASVEVDHDLITSTEFSMVIVANCTALIPIIIFISAIMAYPSTVKQKIIGALLGIVALYTLNLVRTVSLFFIGRSFSESVFEIAHMLVWQSLMIIFAIILWLFWAGRLVRVTPR